MAARHCFLTIALCLAVFSQKSQGCNQLHAVFNFHHVLYFVFGHNNRVVGFDHNGTKTFDGDAGSDVGYHGPITAGYEIPEINRFVLISGDTEHGVGEFGKLESFEPLSWVNAKLELAKEPEYKGIDAAVLREGYTAYYFAGCQFIAISFQNFGILSKGKMDDLGLPCHIDAAWTAADHQTTEISKGHQLYTWPAGDSHAKVDAGDLFHDYPYLADLELCH